MHARDVVCFFFGLVVGGRTHIFVIFIIIYVGACERLNAAVQLCVVWFSLFFLCFHRSIYDIPRISQVNRSVQVYIGNVMLTFIKDTILLG